MVTWLTDDDRERIEEFAQRPAYMRTPEMLVPGEAGAEADRDRDEA